MAEMHKCNKCGGSNVFEGDMSRPIGGPLSLSIIVSGQKYEIPISASICLDCATVALKGKTNIVNSIQKNIGT